MKHAAAIAAAPVLLLAASSASADPYRLRADAVGVTGAPQSPVGLIVLQGEDRERPWVDTEALVWAGSGKDQAADVLVVLVKLHDPTKRAELRLGRQMIATGAVRPLHLDGFDARWRAPIGTTFEGFGGVPVVTAFTPASWDWITGGRVAQSIADTTTIGVSYWQQQASAQLARQEAGFDFAAAPASWFDVSTRGAWDLIDPGLAEGTVSLAARMPELRPEIYATHRSPSRLLPATSLFAALGDIPSDVVGTAVKWYAAPRLDVLPTLAVRRAGGEAPSTYDVGFDASLRLTLRLDDRGDGAVAIEGRRQDLAPERWTGVRFVTRIPLERRITASTELELAVPDDPRGRGAVWPWGLLAVRWVPTDLWEVSSGVEAASTPRAAAEINALVRVSRRWGGP
jgi:hypothetical protein